MVLIRKDAISVDWFRWNDTANHILKSHLFGNIFANRAMHSICLPFGWALNALIGKQAGEALWPAFRLIFMHKQKGGGSCCPQSAPFWADPVCQVFTCLECAKWPGHEDNTWSWSACLWGFPISCLPLPLPHSLSLSLSLSRRIWAWHSAFWCPGKVFPVVPTQRLLGCLSTSICICVH